MNNFWSYSILKHNVISKFSDRLVRPGVCHMYTEAVSCLVFHLYTERNWFLAQPKFPLFQLISFFNWGPKNKLSYTKKLQLFAVRNEKFAVVKNIFFWVAQHFLLTKIIDFNSQIVNFWGANFFSCSAIFFFTGTNSFPGGKISFSPDKVLILAVKNNFMPRKTFSLQRKFFFHGNKTLFQEEK